MRLIAGDKSSGAGHSYLLSAGGGGRPVTDNEFRDALDEVLPRSERRSRGLHARCLPAAPIGVTLVLSGPIAAVPLHAAPWNEGGRAPLPRRRSRGALRAFGGGRRDRPPSRGRAAASSPKLVGLADPKGEFAAAAPEIIGDCPNVRGRGRHRRLPARRHRRFLPRQARPAPITSISPATLGEGCSTAPTPRSSLPTTRSQRSISRSCQRSQQARGHVGLPERPVGDRRHARRGRFDRHGHGRRRQRLCHREPLVCRRRGDRPSDGPCVRGDAPQRPPPAGGAAPGTAMAGRPPPPPPRTPSSTPTRRCAPSSATARRRATHPGDAARPAPSQRRYAHSAPRHVGTVHCGRRLTVLHQHIRRSQERANAVGEREHACITSRAIRPSAGWCRVASPLLLPREWSTLPQGGRERDDPTTRRGTAVGAPGSPVHQRD